MLTSFIDGRLRLRHTALKNPDTLALLERTALGLEGVHGAVGNPRTGSLLLTYDPNVLSRETLLETAEKLRTFLPEEPKHTAKPTKKTLFGVAWTFRQKCRAEAGLMGSIMSATLVGALFNKRLHIAAGTLLAIGSLQHLLRRRKRL